MGKKRRKIEQDHPIWMQPKCNKNIQRKIFKYTKIYKITNM